MDGSLLAFMPCRVAGGAGIKKDSVTTARAPSADPPGHADAENLVIQPPDRGPRLERARFRARSSRDRSPRHLGTRRATAGRPPALHLRPRQRRRPGTDPPPVTATASATI